MKKVLSMALAMMMAMSLVSTAFASSSANSALTRTSSLTGVYNEPKINVTIPTTGNVVLNPYKLTYNVAPNGQTPVNQSDYICFAEQAISNASNVGVEISAVVTGKPTNITLEKQSVKDGNDADLKTTKSAWMYVQFTETGSSGAGTYASTPVFTATEGSATVDAILIQSTASKNTKVLTLDAGTETGSGDEATVTPDVGYFKIAGNIVSKPATAYTKSDKVDVTIAWTITPLVVTTSDGSGETDDG